MEQHLHWSVDPRYLSPIQQRIAIMEVLRTMRMAPVDLLIESLSSEPAYKSYQDGFYRGSGLEHFLNVIERDKRGSKKLFSWMKPRSIKTVLDIIDMEMEDLKGTFRMSVDQVTPSFLRDFDLEKQVIQPMEEKSPVLRNILLRASQTREVFLKTTRRLRRTYVPLCLRIRFCDTEYYTSPVLRHFGGPTLQDALK
jgi:hypothetical protein